MKVTTIGNLTIQRCETAKDMNRVTCGHDRITTAFLNPGGEDSSDEAILALVQCSTLMDDEETASKAAACNTIVVAAASKAWNGTVGVPPPERCVINRKRSIKAKQAAMAAGFCDGDGETEAEVLVGRGERNV